MKCVDRETVTAQKPAPEREATFCAESFFAWFAANAPDEHAAGKRKIFFEHAVLKKNPAVYGGAACRRYRAKAFFSLPFLPGKESRRDKPEWNRDLFIPPPSQSL